MIVVKDKEKARLSLLEEKISDALSLLLQLRNQVLVPATLSDATAPPSVQSKRYLQTASQVNFRRLTFPNVSICPSLCRTCPVEIWERL